MKSNINFPNRLIKKEQKFNSLIDNSLPKVEDYDLIINNIIKQKNRNKERYKDDQYNLEAIIAVSYYIDTGLAYEFRHWICDRTTRRKERAMIVYF